MTKTRKIIILLLISVICWLIVAGWAVYRGRLGSAMDPDYANVFSVTATDAEYVYQAEGDTSGLPGHVSGAVIPSPEANSALTAQAFATLKSTLKSKVLVLVTVADDLNAPAVTSYRDWQTAFGIIQINGELVWEFTESGAVIDDNAVQNAAALAAAVPYVPQYYPDARIVPLVLNANAEPEVISGLMTQIAEYIGDYGVLFISAAQGSRGNLVKESAESLKAQWANCADTDSDALLTSGNLQLLKAAEALFGTSGSTLARVVKAEGSDITFGDLILYYGQ